jgi:hypothetical protein
MTELIDYVNMEMEVVRAVKDQEREVRGNTLAPGP